MLPTIVSDLSGPCDLRFDRLALTRLNLFPQPPGHAPHDHQGHRGDNAETESDNKVHHAFHIGTKRRLSTGERDAHPNGRFSSR
jgi:hypothetical protein